MPPGEPKKVGPQPKQETLGEALKKTVTGRNRAGHILATDPQSLLTKELGIQGYNAYEKLQEVTTAPPPQLEEADTSRVGTDPAIPGSGRSDLDEDQILKDTPVTKGGKGPMRLVGRRVPAAPLYDQIRQGQIEELLLRKTQMEGFAQLSADMVTQRTHENMAFIFENDREEAIRIVTEEFPKLRAAQKKIQQELEDIRTLRVNPYNYLQTAGKGGRAGAVLATMVSQMAAGASGINSARNALKNAIDRDIEGQINDIELQFKGVEAADKNISAQVKLFENELMFREKAQVYAWEAATAIINSAQWGAANESTYLGLQTLRQFAELMTIKAAAEERAKQSTLMYEFNVNTRADVIRRGMQAQQGQDVLDALYSEGVSEGQKQVLENGMPELRFIDENLQGQFGQAVDDVATLQQGTEAPLPAQPASQARPQPRRPRRGASPKSGGGFKADMEFTEEEAGLQESTPEQLQTTLQTGEVPATQGPPSALERPAPKPLPTREQLKSEFQAAANQTGNKNTATMGSFHMSLESGDKNKPIHPGSSPKVWDMGHTMLNDPFTFFGSAGDRARSLPDADFLREWDQRHGFPEFGTFADKEEHAYRTNYQELYERKKTSGKGYVNTITSSTFGDITLVGSNVRKPNSTEHKVLKEKIVDTANYISKLNKASKLLEKTSTRGFLGHRYSKEKGEWVFTPLDVGQQQAQIELKETIDALAIDWIKTKDPSGRLSDQDFARALDAMGGISGRGGRGLADILETMARGGDTSQIRQAVIGFLKGLARDAELSMFHTIGGDTVQSVDAWRRNRERALDDRAFYLRRYKDQGLEPPDNFEANFHYPQE